MKTKSWVLTTMAFLIVAIGYAHKIPKMNIVSAEQQKVLITYEAQFASPLEITIMNDDGDILFVNKTQKSHSEYEKEFNFAEAGDGKYNVCINYGNQSINRLVSISNNKIITGDCERMYEPCFSLQNGKLDISFFNASMKNVNMKIYKNGAYISELNLGNKMEIQKRINMSSLINGEYELVLTDFLKEHRYFVQL
ncbi:MAG: hypothetical protein KAH68_08865 [Draconibacterium sp.]|nr:hypothetical protein [Draconibacterium sp.]